MAKKLIKKENTDTEFTPEQLGELKKCMEDPIYFIENYMMIQHPVRGSIPFKMYPFQRRMIEAYRDNRFNIGLASRQVGKSVTSAAFLLWYAAFQFDKNILIAANKNKNAIAMIDKIRYAYENLPDWLRPGITADGWNKHSIKFDNKSQIVSEATSENTGRGGAFSLLYLDEFAFVLNSIQKEFWTSVSPTLSTGGSCIITSTPNGDADLFAELWRGAELDINGFKPMHIRWDEPPGRDEAFKLDQIGKIGEIMWRQEYECEFISSDALLINPLTIVRLTKELEDKHPVKTINEVVMYENINPRIPAPNDTFIVGVDPATGSGSDYTVIVVYRFPELTQVAEYRSNVTSTGDAYNVLKNILNLFENIGASVYFTIENNGVGEGMLTLYQNDETPLESAQLLSDGGKRMGMSTTKTKKLKSCITLKEMVEKKLITFYSINMLKELKSYVRRGGTYSAQIGATDDIISATLLIVRMLEVLAPYEEEAFSKIYSTDGDDWGSAWESDDSGDSDGSGDDDDFTFLV